MIYKSLTDLIGKTPLLEVNGFEGQKARLILKIEAFNPGGSVKDRIALQMIRDAEKDGLLQPGATIIEPTSGNTGVGLAWVGTSKGYKVILTMPESMSLERRNLLAALGARLELTPASQGMKGAIAKAQELKESIPGSVILGQFVNPSNPKRRKPSIQVIAVEPSGSPVLTEGRSGSHKIQGIGAGFVPQTYDASVIDKVIPVSDEDAAASSRLLASKEGLLVGISSGASFFAALSLAREERFAGKMIVALLPDTGERYLSTGLFNRN